MYKWGSLVISVVLLGHLAALAAQKELWPFSHYPMYARPQTAWKFEAHRVYGISGNGEELPLEPSGYFSPYGPDGVSDVLAEAANRRQLDSTLRAFLAWYDGTRAARNGPPLRGLRSYRVEYALSRELDPRRRDRAPELSRVLEAEVTR